MSVPEGNELVRHRLEQLEAIRARGIDPFGARYPVTHWTKPLAARLGAAPDDAV